MTKYFQIDWWKLVVDWWTCYYCGYMNAHPDYCRACGREK